MLAHNREHRRGLLKCATLSRPSAKDQTTIAQKKTHARGLTTPAQVARSEPSSSYKWTDQKQITAPGMSSMQSNGATGQNTTRPAPHWEVSLRECPACRWAPRCHRLRNSWCLQPWKPSSLCMRYSTKQAQRTSGCRRRLPRTSGCRRTAQRTFGCQTPRKSQASQPPGVACRGRPSVRCGCACLRMSFAILTRRSAWWLEAASCAVWQASSSVRNASPRAGHDVAPGLRPAAKRRKVPLGSRSGNPNEPGPGLPCT